MDFDRRERTQSAALVDRPVTRLVVSAAAALVLGGCTASRLLVEPTWPPPVGRPWSLLTDRHGQTARVDPNSVLRFTLRTGERTPWLWAAQLRVGRAGLSALNPKQRPQQRFADAQVVSVQGLASSDADSLLAAPMGANVRQEDEAIVFRGEAALGWLAEFVRSEGPALPTERWRVAFPHGVAQGNRAWLARLLHTGVESADVLAWDELVAVEVQQTNTLSSSFTDLDPADVSHPDFTLRPASLPAAEPLAAEPWFDVPAVRRAAVRATVSVEGGASFDSGRGTLAALWAGVRLADVVDLQAGGAAYWPWPFAPNGFLPRSRPLEARRAASPYGLFGVRSGVRLALDAVGDRVGLLLKAAVLFGPDLGLALRAQWGVELTVCSGFTVAFHPLTPFIIVSAGPDSGVSWPSTLELTARF